MRLAICLLLVAAATCGGSAGAQRQLLAVVRGAPKDGLVVARVNLLQALGGRIPQALAVQAQLMPGQQPVPAQFAADGVAGGLLIMRLPHGGDATVRLTFSPGQTPEQLAAPLTIHAGGCDVVFDPARMAGFPSAIIFRGTGKRFDTFAWNDRVYEGDRGGYSLRFDPKAQVEKVSEGPLCTVVQVRAAYAAPDGKRPESAPEAVYDWVFFADSPLACVTAHMRQSRPVSWSEIHFLELNFPGSDFTHWAAGDPPQQGEFTASKTSHPFGAWGSLLEGSNAIALLGTTGTFYDGRGEYGTYLHGPWTGWSGSETQFSAWLWLGSAPDAVKTVRESAGRIGECRVEVTTPELHERIAAIRRSAASKQGAPREYMLWRAQLAESAEQAGNLDEAARLSRGLVGKVDYMLRRAGDLGLALQQVPGGLRVASLEDLPLGQELSAGTNPPLFSIQLRRGKEQAAITSDSGWRTAQASDTRKHTVRLLWENPVDERLAGLKVVATATPDHAASAWNWSLQVDSAASGWSVWRVIFPQVAVRDLGPESTLLVPAMCGQIQPGAWRRAYTYQGSYPGGWCAMQLMAAYRPGPHPTGLYAAIHDPWGSTKDLHAESNPAAQTVRLSFDHPAPDMGKPGNGFRLSGTAQWRLLRGDWFDAAMIYRSWVKREAKWWPHLTADGRADTPLWMREMSAWAQTGGGPAEVVGNVKQFAEELGAPVGFHWYSWHMNPFDNDYPHYFPTKPGVAEGVRELQQAGVKVMPYINGRLWDTHDRGNEDFEFTSKALPAVTKDESGKPYIESYGSKESDGSPVRLGVMCPTTSLWRDTLRGIVLRLMNEVGVNGVYIDQVAAASPALCMDPNHGHPLGGGHWWNEGYWKLIGAIRAAMPAGHMLTTECNGEPFVNVFDGYLTWHWQGQGLVPLFPAVYGGAVQMFGRAYGGGPTRDQAFRMKAAQQLVFGEQIGWMDPGLVKEAPNTDFMRQVVHLRRRLARYFYAGEMARPPRVEGRISDVTADWQWSGETIVTMPALLTGAWRIPAEHRAAFLFVNTGDQPIEARIPLNLAAYGIPSSARWQAVPPDGDPAALPATESARRILLEPHRAFAWEARW